MHLSPTPQWLRYSLTLALMGSDDLNLRVLSTSSDDPKERKNAAKVLRLLARGRHWVLVVLLLGNVVRPHPYLVPHGVSLKTNP